MLCTREVKGVSVRTMLTCAKAASYPHVANGVCLYLQRLHVSGGSCSILTLAVHSAASVISLDHWS